MISLVDLVAATLSVTAGAAWLNARWLRLPNSVGLLLIAILISFCLLFLQFALPYWEPQKQAIEAIRQINFPQTLINGMLAYLLFAGALHLDISKLRERRVTVITMATVGVVISTAVVAIGIWIASGLLGVPIPFQSALVFGALISPTDPVAVLSTLKKVVVPATLETEITGESLFNDGIGIVLYVVLLSFALGGPESKLDLAELGRLFLVEIFGGAVSGLAFGFIAYRAMRGIDDYVVEVLISLATATASFAVARAVGASGPIAVVCAGIILGDRGAAFAMSEFDAPLPLRFLGSRQRVVELCALSLDWFGSPSVAPELVHFAYGPGCNPDRFCREALRRGDSGSRASKGL